MYPAGQSKSWDMDEKVQPCWGSDVDYLYSDEDVLILIDALLKKGGKEREKHGLERDIIKEGESFGDTIILAPLSEGDDQEQLVYLTNSIDKAILYRLKQLLVPINVQNVHWVTLQLKIRSVQFGQPEITAVIHDSNGSHTSKIVANLVNSKSISIEAESSLTKIQKEKMNNYCGGYTARLIASLTSDISGVKWGNGEESADDRILRETDLKLVKEYCPHLAHKFCPGQLSTDFQSFNLANRDINRDTGATMSLRYETVLSRVVNHLGKIDDNRIKSLDNDIKLTIEDIISVLQELIHAENNDLVHILSGNTKYGSIFSQNPMKANQSTIELLTQIKFAIARDSGKLIKPMLIISEVIQKETIFPTILIMPRVYKTWNGKVITNKSETLYFVDATSTFERLDSISQLLKQYLCYGSYSNNLTGLFPDGLIECNTVANQVTDAEAIANSGWWNIYNNIMLVHDGSDLFLNRFSERNIERTGKLKYILSLLAIKSLKEKRGCVVSSDSIFDDKRFEEFVKIDNEIKGDYRKIVEDIKASRATTETVDKNSKLMRTDLISEEKTLIYQYNILQEEVNQMEKSTENDPLNYDDDTLAKEIERFVSGKTKEVFEKSSDCKREQLERLVLSNNGAAIRAFVEQTKSEYLERKSSYQMTLDTKEKEQSKLQQSITFLKAEKTSKQEELSRINEILRKLTTEKTIMNQMKNLIQEFIRELRMMNLFNYKEIGAKFNLNALEDKEGTSKVINEVMSSLDSRVKAINKTKNELEEESDQISKQITMLEKKVAEWHIELTRVDKKLNDIITLSRKYNNLKSLISVLEQSKGQNLLEVSNRIRQMQSISSYVGKVQELWNNNSQLKEEAISRVRMGLLGGPLVAIGSAIWERNTFLSKINDKVQSILSGEIADIVYSMKILGCSPTSVAEEINKLQREITKLRNDIYAANEQINGLKKQLELIHKQIAELYCIDDLLSSTSSQITAILKIVIAKLDEIVSSIAANEAAKNQLGIAIKAIENQLITLETKSTVNLLEINKLKPIILNLNRKIQELLEKYREYLTPQDSVTANEYFIGGSTDFSSAAAEDDSHRVEQHTASINCETFSDGLTEKKNILQQVKSRLVKVKEEIELLNSTNNKSTSFLAKDAKEAFVLYTVTQRISLLSMVNIQNHQFVSIGSTKVSESALDNLIKVILEIKKGYRISAYNFVVAADCNRSQEFLKSLDVEIKSIRTLPYDLHDEPISQSLVDEIEGRIKMKDIRSDSSTNRCVLLTEDISQLRLNPDDCIIYEHQNNFVVLKPDVGLDSINERAHVVINNLLNDQLLCMICQMAYRSSGLEMHKRELNSLYSTYKDTLCLLKDNNDEELFLQFIGDLKALTCTEKIISSHIHKLITLYTNVNKYSREYFSVKSGLICLQESFINRMESTVDEESERRKLESEAHIYDDFLMNSKLDKELRIKQDELDSMIEELKNKQEELSKKEKILQKDVNDLKQISIINNKQSKTIQDELSALKVELKEQKKNLLKLESNNLKDKKNDIKKKIKEVEDKINSLKGEEKNLNQEKKKIESQIAVLEKDKRKKETEKTDAEKRKSQLEIEISRQESGICTIKAWIEFISKVRHEFYNNEVLFTKRNEIKSFLSDEKNTLLQIYGKLIEQEDLKAYANDLVRDLAASEDGNRRVEIFNSLNGILTDPTIQFRCDQGNSVCEIRGINLRYSEVLSLIKPCIELKLADLGLVISGSGILISKKGNEKTFEEYLVRNEKKGFYFDKLSLEFTNLLERRIKTEFLSEKINIEQKESYLSKSAREVFQSFQIGYWEVFKAYAGNLVLIANHNIYMDEECVTLHGISLGLIAKNNVVLKEGISIDLSGVNAKSFKCDQAHGYSKNSAAAPKLSKGLDGDNGMDGLSGENGGNLTIKAGRSIGHLDKAKRINLSGGTGGQGQKGGEGQKGGNGSDVEVLEKDIEADNDIGICLCSPCFAIAFTRIPGFNPDSGKFDNEGEKSGAGGNAGKAGLGGNGGFEGSISIADNDLSIKSNQEKLDSSESAESILLKWQDNRVLDAVVGKSGDKPAAVVHGGEAGEAGFYGSDFAIYADSPIYPKKRIHGDFTDLIEEKTYHTIERKIYYDTTKIKNMAQSSIHFGISAVVATAAVLTCAVVGAFALLTAATVGIFSTLLISASLTVVPSATILFAYSRFTSDIDEELKNKNRYRCQLRINKKYVDLKPDKYEKSRESNKRKDERSRGKKGLNSNELAEKLESDRDEHSKASKKENYFADESVVADLYSTALEDSDDAAATVVSELTSELQANQSNNQGNNSILEQVTAEANNLENNLQNIQLKLSKKGEEVRVVVSKLEIVKKELNLSAEQLHQEDSQLLETMEQLEDEVLLKIKLEILEIKIHTKEEIGCSLQQKYVELQTLLNKKKADTEKEIVDLQKEISSLDLAKSKKENDIVSLQKQELLNHADNATLTKEIAEIQSLQKKFKQIKRKEKHKNEEVMLLQDFEMKSFVRLKNSKREIIVEYYDEIDEEKYEIISESSEANLPTLPELIERLLQHYHYIDYSSNIIKAKLDCIINYYDRKILPTTINQIYDEPSCLYEKYDEAIANYNPVTVINRNDAFIITVEKCRLGVNYDVCSNHEYDNTVEYEIAKFEATYGGSTNKNNTDINSLLKLIDLYFYQVKEMIRTDYPLTNILNGNMNRFYYAVISNVINSLQAESDCIINAQLQSNNDIYQIKNLIDAIKVQLHEINYMKICKNRLLAEELSLLEDFLADFQEIQKEVDLLNNNVLIVGNKYKIALKNEFLQQQLKKVLAGKLKLCDYQLFRSEIQNTEIISNRQKEDLLLSLKLRSDQNESIGLCLQGIIEKYELNLDSSSSMNQLLRTILAANFNNDQRSDIIKACCYLLNHDYDFSNYQELRDLYTLLFIRPDQFDIELHDLLDELEYILSKKHELYILNSFLYYEKDTKEFNELFFSQLEYRTTLDESNPDIYMRKAAYYNNVMKLINREINSMESKGKFIVLMLSMTQGKFAGKISTILSEDESLLHAQLAINVKGKNTAEIFEEIVFELAEVQFKEVSSESMNREEPRPIDRMIEHILATKLDLPYVIALKDYVLQLKFKRDDQQRVKTLQSASNCNDVMNLIVKFDTQIMEEVHGDKQSHEENLGNRMYNILLQYNEAEVVDKTENEHPKEFKQFLLLVITSLDHQLHAKNLDSKTYLLRFLLDLFDLGKLIFGGKWEIIRSFLDTISSLQMLTVQEKNELTAQVYEVFNKQVQNIVFSNYSNDGEADKDVIQVLSIINEIKEEALADTDFDYFETTIKLLNIVNKFFDEKKSVQMKYSSIEKEVEQQQVKEVDELKKNFIVSIEKLLAEKIRKYFSSEVQSESDLILVVIKHFRSTQSMTTDLKIVWKGVNFFAHYFNLHVYSLLSQKMYEKLKTVEEVLIQTTTSLHKAQQNENNHLLFSIIVRANNILRQSYRNSIHYLLKDIGTKYGSKRQSECESVAKLIIEDYTKKQISSGLTVKGKTNFIKVLVRQIEHYQSGKTIKELNEFLLEIFNITKKEKRISKIEHTLTNLINSQSIQHILEENKFLASVLNINSTTSTVFSYLFVDDKESIGVLIRLIDSLKSNIRSGGSISHVIARYYIEVKELLRVYFDSADEQELIEEARQQLLGICYEYENHEDKVSTAPMLNYIDELLKMLIKTCYRIHNFVDYIDHKEQEVEYPLNTKTFRMKMLQLLDRRFDVSEVCMMGITHLTEVMQASLSEIDDEICNYNHKKLENKITEIFEFSNKKLNLPDHLNFSEDVVVNQATIEVNKTKKEIKTMYLNCISSENYDLIGSNNVENVVNFCLKEGELDVIFVNWLLEIKKYMVKSLDTFINGKIITFVGSKEVSNYDVVKIFSNLVLRLNEIDSLNLKLGLSIIYYDISNRLSNVTVSELDAAPLKALLLMRNKKEDIDIEILFKAVQSNTISNTSNNNENNNNNNSVEYDLSTISFVLSFTSAFSLERVRVLLLFKQSVERLTAKNFGSMAMKTYFIGLNQLLLNYYYQNSFERNDSNFMKRSMKILNYYVHQFIHNIETVESEIIILTIYEAVLAIEDHNYNLTDSESIESAKQNYIFEILMNKFSLIEFTRIFITRNEQIYCKLLYDFDVLATVATTTDKATTITSASDKLLTIIKDNNCELWEDVLENEFVKLMCNKIFCEEIEFLSSINFEDRQQEKEFINTLKLMIESTYFDQNDNHKLSLIAIIDKPSCALIASSEKVIIQKLIKDITSLKSHIFTTKELFDKQDWIALVANIERLRTQERNGLKLEEVIEIMAYSQISRDISKFNNVLMNYKVVNGKNQIRELIALITLDEVLMKISTEASNTRIHELRSTVKRMQMTFKSNTMEFLGLVIEQIVNDIKRGFKYKDIDIHTLSIVLDLCMDLHVYDNKELMQHLFKTKILLWQKVLKKEKLKYELSRDDQEILDDFIQIEKFNGQSLTQQLINVLKKNKIKDIELKYIIKKFKKREWELSENNISKLNGGKCSEWISILKKVAEEGCKPLSTAELIDAMRKFQKIGEINYDIKDLLFRDGDNCNSIIKNCLNKIDSVLKNESKVIKLETETRTERSGELLEVENTDVKYEGKCIKDFDREDIQRWTNIFKVNKGQSTTSGESGSIDSSEIFELVAVICRGSEIAYGYQLRHTQKIAVLLFIDSMISKVFQGRIGNIFTSEGKTLIVIATAIAQLLLKGGNVDILSSSEVLAERDAKISEPLFHIFNIEVSNNCDSEAMVSEENRKERYQKNQVIYGEIGYFQRDILLTRYYNKDIRDKVATCLIVDEADSMCVDNSCNTLYISHKIADLRYLKDIIIHIWKAIHSPATSIYSKKNVKKVKEAIQELIQQGNIIYPSYMDELVQRGLEVRIENAYLAKLYMQESDQYSVMDSGKEFGRTIINDLATGVEQINTQWSDGLQQFVELKHYRKLTSETFKAIFISNYLFFRSYGGNLYGMSGTLGGPIERELLHKLYEVDFYQLPRFKRDRNIREETELYHDQNSWLKGIENEVEWVLSERIRVDLKEKEEAKSKEKALRKSIEAITSKILNAKRQLEKLNTVRDGVKQVEDTNIDDGNDYMEEENNGNQSTIENNLKKHLIFAKRISKLQEELQGKQFEFENIQDIMNSNSGRAALIICERKKDVERIKDLLIVTHSNLYLYPGKLDGLYQLGNNGNKVLMDIEKIQIRPGDIIIATNIAGRGTDFRISPLLERCGGFHVILSYIPPNIRVEDQAFGRSGRNGQPGSGKMIVYDLRAVNGMDMDDLIEERDYKEYEKLENIQCEFVPRVKMEGELFQKFDELCQNCSKDVSSKNSSTSFQAIQRTALFNKWALWLEEMSSRINEVHQAFESNKIEILQHFNEFKNDIIRKSCRPNGLVEGIGELLELARFYIQEGLFSEAVAACDQMIELGAEFAGFAYYYKAMALFRPLKEINLDKTVESIRRFCGGHVINFEDKKKGIQYLKKAVILFEEEIECIKGRSHYLASVQKIQREGGIGSEVDYFSQSNANEITVLSVHLDAAKKALTQEINVQDLSQSLNNSLFTPEESLKIFHSVINESSTEKLFKEERVSWKARVWWHVNVSSCVNVGDIHLVEVRNYKDYSNKNRKFIVVGDLTEDTKNKLKEKKISYCQELYRFDKEHSNYEWVRYPVAYDYSKELVLSSISSAIGKGLGCRVSAVREISSYILSKEKIWSAIKGLTKETEVFQFTEDSETQLRQQWSKEEFFGEAEQLQRNLKELAIELGDKTSSNVQKQFSLKRLKDCIPSKVMQNFDTIRMQLQDRGIINTMKSYIFRKEIADKISDNNDKIILIAGSASDYSSIDWTLHAGFESSKDKIIDVLKQNEEHNKEDIIDMLAEIKVNEFGGAVTKEVVMQFEKDNLDLEFMLLKSVLIMKGLAKKLTDSLSFDGNENEKNEISTVIEELSLLPFFTQENIDIYEFDNLLQVLKSARIIKGKQVNYSLRRDPKLNGVKDGIEAVAKKVLERAIDERIARDTYLSKKEVDDDYNNKIQLISTIPEIIEFRRFAFQCTADFFKKLSRSTHDEYFDENRWYNINVDEAKELLTILKENENSVRKEIKGKLSAAKKLDDVTNLSTVVVDSFVDSIGQLKSFERTVVYYRNVGDYFFGSYQIPSEVSEYVSLHKDMVLTFVDGSIVWDWKAFAIAVFGIIQITCGALLIAYPILGPWSYHIGSGLISEGASDIMFAIQNAGSISGPSYLYHKICSLAVTAGAVAVGGFLSSGAAVIKMGAGLTGNVLFKAIGKKIAGEVIKAVYNTVEAFAIQKLSAIVTAKIFNEFKESIAAMIKKTIGYESNKQTLTNEIKELQSEVIFHQNQHSLPIVSEKVKDAVQELNNSINNQVAHFTQKVGGALVNQIGEASRNIQYSGLKLDKVANNLANSKMKQLGSIMKIIDVAMKVVKHVNNIYELGTLVNKVLVLVTTKIQYKKDLLLETRDGNKNQALQDSSSTNNKTNIKTETYTSNSSNTTNHIESKSQSLKNSSEDRPNMILEARRTVVDSDQKHPKQVEKLIICDNQEKDVAKNETIVRKCVAVVEDRIFESVREKVEHNFVNPAFTSLINHTLKPLTEQFEKSFLQDFNQMKQRALAYAEYNRRYDSNREETGVEIDLVKDHLIDELKSFKFNSPIKEIDLKDIPDDFELEVTVDGKVKVLRMSNKADKDFIRDRIGKNNIRILPGNPPKLSRPNYASYISSWDMDKQISDTDLSLIARKIDQPIWIRKADGNWTLIGDMNGKEPLMMEFQKHENGTGHFCPLVSDGNGGYSVVDELQNVGNCCGIESILYLQARASGKSDSAARAMLEQGDTRQNFIRGVQRYAMTSFESRYDHSLRRQETSGMVGGIRLNKKGDIVFSDEDVKAIHKMFKENDMSIRRSKSLIKGVDSDGNSIALALHHLVPKASIQDGCQKIAEECDISTEDGKQKFIDILHQHINDSAAMESKQFLIEQHKLKENVHADLDKDWYSEAVIWQKSNIWLGPRQDRLFDPDNKTSKEERLKLFPGLAKNDRIDYELVNKSDREILSDIYADPSRNILQKLNDLGHKLKRRQPMWERNNRGYQVRDYKEMEHIDYYDSERIYNIETGDRSGRTLM